MTTTRSRRNGKENPEKGEDEPVEKRPRPAATQDESAPAQEDDSQAPAELEIKRQPRFSKSQKDARAKASNNNQLRALAEKAKADMSKQGFATFPSLFSNILVSDEELRQFTEGMLLASKNPQDPDCICPSDDFQESLKDTATGAVVIKTVRLVEGHTVRWLCTVNVRAQFEDLEKLVSKWIQHRQKGPASRYLKLDDYGYIMLTKGKKDFPGMPKEAFKPSGPRTTKLREVVDACRQKAMPIPVRVFVNLSAEPAKINILKLLPSNNDSSSSSNIVKVQQKIRLERGAALILCSDLFYCLGCYEHNHALLMFDLVSDATKSQRMYNVSAWAPPKNLQRDESYKGDTMPGIHA